MVAEEIILDRYGGGEEARNAFQLVTEVCAEVFAGTPRETARLLERRSRWAERTETPGFVLVLARVGPDVVGFAHGFAKDDVFEISEVAVREAWRDAGIERLLRDALLERR